MAVKIDKEVLIKHHFWILVGVLLLLALIPLFVLGTSVSATVKKEKEKLDAKEKEFNGVRDFKNQRWVDAYKEQDKLIDQKRTEVWMKAWETQKDLMTFPEAMASSFKGRYIGDEFDNDVQEANFKREKFVDEYNKQLDGIYNIVQPVNLENGQGAVQVKGGNWEAFLGLQRTFAKKPPTKDDIWLAQEDLWVKRELLWIIRNANDSVARFHEVKPGDEDKVEKADPFGEPISFVPKKAVKPASQPKTAKKPTASDPNHKTFRNQNWELDLTLAKNDDNKYVLRGKLTNISKRRQTLGETFFKVFLQDRGPDSSVTLLPVSREPMAIRETHVIKDVPISDQLIVEGLYRVDQVLNWRTAPIKRIDALLMADHGALSARTSNLALVGPRWIIPPPAAGAAAAPAEPRGRSLEGSGGRSAALGATDNGLKIPRYIDANEEVRHMPVAMALLVQEENIPDVLAAFVNSKLRISVNQFHWQHSRESIMPPFIESAPPPVPVPGRPVAARPSGPASFESRMDAIPGRSGGGRVTAAGGGGRGGRGGGEGGRGGGGGEPGEGGGRGRAMPQAGSGGQPASLFGGARSDGSVSVEQEEDMNLIDLSVYGIAALYEQYPPKPEGGAARK